MLSKSVSFFLSVVLIVFFLIPNKLYSARRIRDKQFLLHKAIQQVMQTKNSVAGLNTISDLVASGCKPTDICRFDGRTAWELIALCPGNGYKKKSLRYAINKGLRLFLKKNPEKRVEYLGDCGNPDCDLAEKALQLSMESNSKNRRQTLITAYAFIVEKLKKKTCKNLCLHVFEGRNLRDVLLSSYCKISQQMRTSFKKSLSNEMRNLKEMQIKEIQKYVDELWFLLKEDFGSSKKRNVEVITISSDDDNEGKIECFECNESDEGCNDECVICPACGGCSDCEDCPKCPQCPVCPDCEEERVRSLSIKHDYLCSLQKQKSSGKLGDVGDELPDIITLPEVTEKDYKLSYAELFSGDSSTWFEQ